MHGRFLVSSFNHKDLLIEVQHVRKQYKLSYPKGFDIIYLHNYHNDPFPSPLTERDLMPLTFEGDGFNVSASYLSEELISFCKSRGLKLGVWIRAGDFVESDCLYFQIQEMGVDFICSDYPLKARQYLESSIL